MNIPKISLIGSGNIGGELAKTICMKRLGQVVLIDKNYDRSNGKLLDINQSNSFYSKNNIILATNDIEAIKDSDVIVVTAGIARKDGMSRDDLLVQNTSVIQNIGYNISKYAPNAFVIIVTNPLDVMSYVMQKISQLDKNKVIGMAGVLDTIRFNYFLSLELNVSVDNIQSFVLGGHGDSMVPMIRFCSVSGIPLLELVQQKWITLEQINSVIHRTKNSGAEIVKLLQTSSAFYAPAESIIYMLESYLFNLRRVIPCSVSLAGEYGVNDIYFGVPTLIGSNGVEKIIELNLNQEEKDQIERSANELYSTIKSVDKILID